MPNPIRISIDANKRARTGPIAARLVAIAGVSVLAELGPILTVAQTAAAPPPRAFAAVDSRARTQEVCLAATLAAARECALAKCRKGGGQDCRVTAACQPAKWAGNLNVMLQGSQFPLTICGVPSRPGLIARLKDLCRGYRSRGLEGCSLDTVWTPAGEAETAGLRWSRSRLWQGRAVAR